MLFKRLGLLIFVIGAAFGARAETVIAGSCELDLSPRLFRNQGALSAPALSADRAKSARLKVEGGQSMSGTVRVSPAKNAYLPILAAALLNRGKTELVDMPELRDLETFMGIFATIGVKTSVKGRITTIDASDVQTNVATCDLIKTMRASILMLGPLLTRFGGSMVGLPGGCPIGARPIDIHIDALKKMGARIVENPDWILADVNSKLKGTEITFSFPSVGATQHILMAAALAEGRTIIHNGAREPEVDDVADFLVALGAKIQNDGHGNFIVDGVEQLNKNVRYTAIGDRIEAATYIIGALMSGTELRVEGFTPSHIQSVLDTLKKMGARLEIGADFVQVRASGRLKAVGIKTGPHPEFPTDVQAQIMALMTQADGTSVIQETIFENRFQHAAEMNKMGANIEVQGDRALIHGPTRLKGANVKCTDLRGGVALIMNALIAEGDSDLSDIYYVDRGYHRFIEKFAGMSACKMQRTGN
jgi:UDP-N-acetylglucosamine 1-carboxyvinyltransferase